MKAVLGRVLLCSFPALFISAPLAEAQSAELQVERLGALPSLIGTAPTHPVWSPDSSLLAFLWNDHGTAFRDIWMVSAGGDAGPERLTVMAEHSGLREASELEIDPDLPKEGPFTILQKKVAAREDQGVSEVVWIPDGRALVFSFHGDLYRVNAEGGKPKRLTHSGKAKTAICFSPDGRFLSYLQGGDLWLWDQETQEQVQVTHLGVPPVGRVPGSSFDGLDVGIVSYKWSSDGHYVAVYYEDRRKVRKMLFPNYLTEEITVETLRRDLPGENDWVRALGVYSARSGQLQMVDLEGKTDRRIGSYEWSPNSTFLLIDQSSEDAEDRWIYVLAAGGLTLRELWHSSHERRGSTTSAFAIWTSAWKSDGEGIVFVSDVEGWLHLYAMSLGGGEAQSLTEGDWSIVGAAFEGGSLTVSPRTRQVFFVSTKKSPHERQVYRMSEDGGPVDQVTSLPGTHQPFVAPDGSTVAVLHSNDTTPTELYILGTEDGSEERRITRSPVEEFYDFSWIEPRYVTFKSRTDGVTLHARILEPPNLDRSKKYPVILGPVYSNTVRNRWAGNRETLQQYLAMEGGYIQLQVDIRGSVGYGRQFREDFVLNVGEIDIEDLHSGVEYLKTLPYVDPDRIGIWGWSYGGLLTAMSLFKKPGVYQAGVAGAPATNVWHATTGEVNLSFRPSAYPEAYRKGSAITYAENLADPLMIIHGMQDSIVLFKDSLVLAETLMMAGKDFEFVPLPSSVHDAWRRPHLAAHVMRKIVQFFDRHLGPGPQ